MSEGNPIHELLSMYGWRLPLIIVYIIGLTLTLILWRRHPGASLLSAVAFGLFLASSIAGGAWTWFTLRPDVDIDSRGLWLGVGNLVFTLMNVAAWILLLLALFARRPQPPAWNPDDPGMYDRPFSEASPAPRPPGPASKDIRR